MEPLPSQDQILEAYNLVSRTRNIDGIHVGNVLIKYDQWRHDTPVWWVGNCRYVPSTGSITIQGRLGKGKVRPYQEGLRLWGWHHYLTIPSISFRFSVLAQSKPEMIEKITQMVRSSIRDNPEYAIKQE